uniref:bifunctional tetrahydrofolate synthase/dihydrofolate synthase n=1 Tax=Marinobacterium profundum TaxID=1714300 RepID=UPI00082E679E|nr:bifunctional tetrahydrofolate synthase/dihydrofolate synthase [Marinobacterium profundum]
MATGSPMALNEWLERIEACHPSDIELGLDRVRDVATRLELDFSRSKVVTIAGTNGKGSTQTFLDCMLREAGYSTGCYSSPHFLRYNERVRINGDEASDEALCSAFEAVEAARGEIPLTYFEYGTLAALKIFSQKAPDFVLLEVGLGGRLDAVNIVDPQVAVVTSIALDHTDWLGDTRELIGREKAGIFRADTPAVCGDPEPPVTVAQAADELGARLYQVGDSFTYLEQAKGWHWQGRNLQGESVEFHYLPLPGLPLPNAATALQVLHLLLEAPSRSNIESALRNACMTGRMQRLMLDDTECILDVAHNPQAAQYIAGRLAKSPPVGRQHVLLGMLNDKDVNGVLKALQPVAQCWHFAGLGGPRGQSAAALALRMRVLDPLAQCLTYSDVAEALAGVRAQVAAGDRVLIAGSFFTVSEALAKLELQG